MQNVTLGTTGITVPQNAFGALPIQRIQTAAAIKLLQRAYDGGMRYFDTARAYSDSEEKIGLTFSNGLREQIFIATKTMAKTPEAFKEDLTTSLKNLKTEYIDVYQFHCAEVCYRPGDGTGMYECMEDAKRQGKIRHVGITAHKIGIAMEAAKSGLYETLQFPFSYLSGEKEQDLVRVCQENQVGFVCMKGLAGGLITNSKAAMAFTAQFSGALPIWGIQKEDELTEWLSYMTDTPEMTDEIRSFIDTERQELSGNFCRGCGYCMTCPAGITINQCARMSLMLRRAPSKFWLSDYWQKEMKKIEGCLHCNKCMSHCPYELNTPELLAKNYDDYKKVLAGEIKV